MKSSSCFTSSHSAFGNRHSPFAPFGPSTIPATHVTAFTSFMRARSKAKKTARLLFCVAVLLAGSAATVCGQSALDGFDPNANGFVRVVVFQPDGKILIGGDFTDIGGQPRNRIARLNPDGTLDTAFDPNANNPVYSIALQADGKILVGGDFTNIGGQPRNRIARLDATTGLADSFDPNADSRVSVIAVQADGKVLAGGFFSSIGGQNRNRIARLDATTGLADSFNPNANSFVVSIVVQADGKILVGGFFSGANSIGGQTRNRIARLDATTGLADSFDPNANSFVFAIAVQADGKILVGGGFNGANSIGGATRNRIARLDATTGLADSFDPNTNASVRSIALQADGKILAGGDFTGANSIGGQSRNRIARLDATTGLADSFNPNANSDVLSIAVQADGKILAGGVFTSLSPNGGAAVTRNNIARLEIDGRLDQTLNLNLTSAGGLVVAIAVQPDGKTLIGGSFTTVLGVTRNNIARLNTDGTLDTTFDPNANNTVYAIAVQADGKILVGGFFSGANSIGGATRNRMARLDATTGAADSFDPNANSAVQSIVVQADGKILAGGFFVPSGGQPSIGGQFRNYIARLDPTTGLADSFDPNANSPVRSIAVQADGKILAGGDFSGANSIGGQTRNRIARLDATTGLADSFNPNANANGVYAIAVQADGKILAGGFFTTIGGQTRNHIARLDAATGLADSFNPSANAQLYSIAVQADGKILAGGQFTGANSIGGQTRSRIARLDPTTGLADSFNPSANSQVFAVAVQTDGKVLAGGQFSNIGGQTRNLFARLSNDTAALQNLTVTPSTITWTRAGSSPQFTRVTFESSTDNVNYTLLGNGTAAGSNWTLNGMSFSLGQTVYIRARGYYRSGYQDGSESITESVRNALVAPPTFTINNVTLNEGNSSTTNFVFTVTSTGSSALTSVDFQTQDGTATVANGDYVANNGTLTFAAGETIKTITVLVNGDTTFETNEAFTVNLSNASGATISDGSGAGTVTNDDTAPSFSISGAGSSAEGDSGTTAYVFTVTKNGSTALTSSVDFATADGTATAGGDYVDNSGTLTFAPGDTTKEITVLINGDMTFENNETFTVALTNPVNATISISSAPGSILNDDTAPTFAIDDVTHNEGNTGQTSYVFTITKTGATALSASVTFATVNGTATTADFDYSPNSGTRSFAANETTKQITVLVTGEAKYELDEAFTVHLSTPAGASISDADGTGAITNDDAAPSFTINDVSHNEGNSGTTDYVFTVTKNGSTGLSSAVDYATVDGTALAPNDYTAIPTTTLTFLPGDTTKQFTVLVNGDTLHEANETFTVHLSNASAATIGDADGTGTLTNDDAAPLFAIDDVSHNEGDTGTTSYVFTVTKTGVTATNTTVDYATVGGTATAPSDYTAIPTTTLTFLPGETTKQITVLVNGDTAFELDEAYTVHLSNAAISDADGTGTIVNDDCTAPPAGMVGWWPWQNDGNDIIGTSPATLSGSPSFAAGKVGQALVLNGTSQHAIAPASSSLNVGAGNGLTIDLWINPTDVSTLRPMVEYNRGANIGLDQGLGAQFWIAVAQDGGGPGSLFTNLRDSDAANHVVSTPQGVIVANQWQHVALTYDKTSNSGTITIYVNGVIKRQVINLGAFTPQTTYPVNFGARLAQGTFRYSGAMDEVEIFNRALSQAEIQSIFNAGSNGKCHPSTLQLSSATYTVSEKGTSATITVSRTGTNAIAATVDYATVAGGTAIAGDDYTPASGTLTFNPSETSKTFDIVINDDNIDEPDETVNIALSNVAGPASLGSQSTAVLTIVDNDIPVDNSADSGPGSLRDALEDAQDGDTIVFEIPGPRPHNPAVVNTITLTSGELVIDKSITLLGPGADVLTVERDANASAFRIFNVTPGHTVTIQGITISGGHAQGAFPAEAGGGIYNDHSTLTVKSCTVSGNSAANYGAGMFNNGQPGTASLTVTNSTLNGNVCGGTGGGIYNFGESTGHATLTVSNTTFSGNSSVAGGGIMNDGTAGNATLTVTNSTFNGNTAPNGGGSDNIYNDGNSAGIATLDIGNTILNAADGNILNVNGTVTSLGYNLSSDNFGGYLTNTGDQINTDPILGPLKNNGGPTKTHAPLSNSPAIDRGKDIGATGRDQRGSLRPVTYNDPSIVPPTGSDRSDIGAVELPPGVQPSNAASHKTHGLAGDKAIDLPLTGTPGIECRSGGVTNDYQVILNFAGPVSFTSPAVVTSGSGSVVSGTGNGTNQITLNLTGVTNAQIITLALFDANDGANSGDVGVRMGVLVGDATGSATVNSTDVSQTKLRSGQAASAANFRSDFNASGTINATDVSTVKIRSGTSLP